MNLIPTISPNGELSDGKYIKAIPFCKSNHNSRKCADFYRRLYETKSPGFYTCPYGMSCYLMISENGVPIVFTGMKERKSYDKSKAKIPNQQTEGVYNPVLQEAQIMDLIDATLSIELAADSLAERETAVAGISHEVKKLNSQIKERSDLILQAYRLIDDDVALSNEDLKKLRADIRTIFVSSSMIEGRYELYDYEKNPDALSQGRSFHCNIYKKFDKIKRIFQNYLKKGIPINITGSSYDHIKAYSSFELIPLLLIENAIKYSYQGNSVDIAFVQHPNNCLEITIDSYSPYCSADELSHIFDKGFRGKNAKKVSSDGSGIGLYFVKLLCDLHDVEITASSNSSKVTAINNVAYAPFRIKLVFSDTYNI